MKRVMLGGLVLAALAVSSGCRCVLGFEDPTLTGGGGTGGIGGTGGTGGAGGTAGTTGGGGGCVVEECPESDNGCKLSVCVDDVCGFANAPAGTVPTEQVPGDCKRDICDAAGEPVSENDDTDVGDDGNECTFDVCASGEPDVIAKDEGTPCSRGYCSAAAACVECTEPEHCNSGVCLPNGTCKSPTCDDNVQNGDETGLDCGGSTCPPCGECLVDACPIWSNPFGDPKDQFVRSLAVDIGGKLLIAGDVAGTTIWGGTEIAGKGGPDIFVAKLDTAGGVTWAKNFGDAGAGYGRAVSADLFGNVIVTGETAGTVDFGGGSLGAAFYDVFVVKLDPTGGHIWSKLYGDSAAQRAFGSATDTDNNVILVGGFEGKIDFGGGELTSAGFEDVFIAKLDPDGNEVWSRRFGKALDQRAIAVATDVTNSIYVTGWFEGTIDFGTGDITSAGGEDGFLVKLGSDGNVQWVKTFGDEKDQRPLAVTAGISGGPTVTGYFKGSMSLPGGPTLTSAGDEDVFLVKLNSLGNHQVSKSYGTAGRQSGTGIAVDQTGDLILTGNFFGSIDFGGGALTSMGATDVFVAKVDSTGVHKWSLRFGDSGVQSFATVGTNSMNQIFLAASFGGTVDLGLGQMSSAGGSDILLAKLGP